MFQKILKGVYYLLEGPEQKDPIFDELKKKLFSDREIINRMLNFDVKNIARETENLLKPMMIDPELTNGSIQKV